SANGCSLKISVSGTRNPETGRAVPGSCGQEMRRCLLQHPLDRGGNVERVELRRTWETKSRRGSGRLQVVVLFVLTVSKAAVLADQQFLTLRAGNGHIGLIDAEVRLAALRVEGLVTGFAHQGLFAKAAF